MLPSKKVNFEPCRNQIENCPGIHLSSSSCLADLKTTFSIILPMKGRLLYIGLYLLNIVLSRLRTAMLMIPRFT